MGPKRMASALRLAANCKCLLIHLRNLLLRLLSRKEAHNVNEDEDDDDGGDDFIIIIGFGALHLHAIISGAKWTVLCVRGQNNCERFCCCHCLLWLFVEQ